MPELNTEILRRAQKGDAIILGQLYENFHQKIFRYLYYQVGDQQAAEDLTSEVFVRMLRFVANIHPKSGSFQAWLFQIARNLAIDHHRQHRNHREEPLEEHVSRASEETDRTVETILTSENLRSAIDQLTEEQRDVIVLRFVAQMSINETAETLNKTEDSVKGLQRRGLIALRDLLDGGEGTHG